MAIKPYPFWRRTPRCWLREIETDYLVVGAGASGMAFVDSVIAESDADVVMIDRRHRPGGHWLDAYPFVRLHQPSVYYGVNSRVLGDDRTDDSGPNAGFYERATATEICSYFNRVLEEHLIPSGRVRFFGMCDYLGEAQDGHLFVSRVTGEETTVKVRRKFVDPTYVESSMIRWVRPRDGWMQNRAYMQPLELVGSYMELQAHWVQAAAEANDGRDFAHRLEAAGVFVRLDPGVEPDIYRGATLSTTELESLRRIENVVRQGRVIRIGRDSITLQQGLVTSDTGQVFVDCTAAGVRPTIARPVFEPARITLQHVTIGIVPWGAATIAVVEASREDDADKNRLCPPLTWTGLIADVPHLSYVGMSGLTSRSAEPDLAAWNEASRLNPVRGAFGHLDDPRVQSAFESLGANFGPAMSNLERLVNGDGSAG